MGVSALIASNPTWLRLIQIAGAVYLIYIAWLIWHSPTPTVGIKHQQDSLPPGKVFIQSVIANLLNPKVILFFLALFPQFIDEQAEQAGMGIWIMGLTFILMTWIIFSLVGLFAGTLSRWLAKHQRVARWIPRISALLLFSIAMVLLWQ